MSGNIDFVNEVQEKMRDRSQEKTLSVLLKFAQLIPNKSLRQARDAVEHACAERPLIEAEKIIEQAELLSARMEEGYYHFEYGLEPNYYEPWYEIGFTWIRMKYSVIMPLTYAFASIQTLDGTARFEKLYDIVLGFSYGPQTSEILKLKYSDISTWSTWHSGKYLLKTAENAY